MLAELAMPRAIVVHPRRGVMFWSEWSRNQNQRARIGRANLDGTDVTYIRYGTDVTYIRRGTDVMYIRYGTDVTYIRYDTDVTYIRCSEPLSLT